MTAAPVTIVCANCGAKYKLPADFKAASAKCKGCGATIDVAGQLRAPAAATSPAAAATPRRAAKASEPPATARAASKTSSARGTAGSARRGSKTATASTTEGAGRRERGQRTPRGAATPPKAGGNKVVLVGSLVAIVALGVVGYFVMSGDKPASTDTTATAPGDPDASKVPPATAGNPEAGVRSAQDEADELAKELAAGAGGGRSTEVGAEGGEAANTADAPKPANEGQPEAAKPPAKQAQEASSSSKPPAAAETKPLSPEEVFDPSTLEPLAYPDYVSDELRQEIQSLCEDVRNGGRAGINAKRRLEEIGHPAIVGVVNTYQKIDFKDPAQAMFAFEMNKFLTNAFGAGVISATFKRTEQGDPIPPETANFNANTVLAWRRFWEKNSDKETWEKFVNARKEGKKAGDDGDK